MKINQDEIYSTADTAKLLHVAESTLNVWRSTGRQNLKFLKIGRKILYRGKHLQEFLKECERTTTE